MPASTKEEPVARYLLSVHAVEGEGRAPMTEEQMKAFMRNVGELEQDMTAADALVYSARLEPAESAKVVAVRDGKPLTTDGPFAETKEQLGGFYIIDAEDFDEAVSWAQRTSECIGRPIEVRAFAAMRGSD
jgi:hypothetical protein